MSSRRDIVVFGATGYTGQFVVREMVRIAATEGLTWAVAGRSQAKLSQVLKSIGIEQKLNLDAIPVIVVDVADKESIRRMCEQASVLINCVGPYRFFGEDVVKQCVLSRTHHLDLSGEPEFLERIQLNYNREALANGVFIVGSCGFDSVPADLGVAFTKKQFANDISYIESFLTFENSSKTASSFNYATWESAVYGFASAPSLRRIRKQLLSSRLPETPFRAPTRTNWLGFFRDEQSDKNCVEFLGSDRSVVKRTQHFNYEVLDQRPIQYMPYLTLYNSFYTSMYITFGLIFSVLANYRFGRFLLLKFYKFFSCGVASKKETTMEEMKNIKFKMQFRAVGFDKTLPNKNEQFSEPPTQTIVTEISGPEPGYIATSKIITQCALVLLRESDKIPVKGGVLTPGAAFANSSLLERLVDCGMKFDVLRNDSTKKQ